MRVFSINCIICILLLGSNIRSFSQDKQQIQGYEIAFTIVNAGFGVDGQVEGLEAQIFFNPRQPDQCSIAAVADASSIRTGIRIRDNHLKRSDYFDVENHPHLKLSVRGFRPGNEKNSFRADFTLTLKGITKTFVAPVFYQPEGDVAKLSSNFTINRLAFDIGAKSAILSEEVEVRLEAHLVDQK